MAAVVRPISLLLFCAALSASCAADQGSEPATHEYAPAERALAASPGDELDCSDGVDDGGDGAVDCADADCLSDGGCATLCGADLRDDDGDGHTACPGYAGTDCDDAEPEAFPGRAELCDGIDNDCNGLDDVLGYAGSETDDDGDGTAECDPCAGARPDFEIFDFSTFGNMRFIGPDSGVLGSELRIVSEIEDRVGAVWMTDPVSVAWGFDAVFEYHFPGVSGVCSQGPGEGLAFTIQNDSLGARAGLVGGGGQYGIPNSLAVEVRTGSDSVLATSCGTSANAGICQLISSSRPVSGAPRPTRLRVRYREEAGRIFLYHDGEGAPMAWFPVDLDTLLSLDAGRAWVGFTASTETDRCAEMRITSFTFTGTCAGGLPDCDDGDPNRGPHRIEWICNGLDDDCDGNTIDNPDSDGDGYGVCPDPVNEDCDDWNAFINPGSAEIACNGADDDCDDQTPDTGDHDADGWDLCDGDCDDTNAAVFPGNGEQLCDGLDNDCNPITRDEVDSDGDGVGGCSDCDDSLAAVFPGNDESPCNGTDDDCDSATVDNPDNDGDGYDACGDPDTPADCDDNDPAFRPDALDGDCDGIDENCSGEADEAAVDLDGDGESRCTDCDDEDAALSHLDSDNDGFISCPSAVAADCDDRVSTVYPGALEIPCNDRDDNCDGTADLPCEEDGGCSTASSPRGAMSSGLILLLLCRRRSGASAGGR